MCNMAKLRIRAVVLTLALWIIPSLIFACMGSEVLILPAVGIGVGIMALGFAALKLRGSKQIWKFISYSLVGLSGALALFLPLVFFLLTEASSGWKCSFSHSVLLMFIFHIGIPFSAGLFALLLRAKMRDLQMNWSSFWAWIVWSVWAAHLSGWGGAVIFQLLEGFKIYNLLNIERGAHYTEVVAIFLFVALLPILAARFSQKRRIYLGVASPIVGSVVFFIVSMIFSFFVS